MKLTELYTTNHLRVPMPIIDGQNNYDTLDDYASNLEQHGFKRLGQGKFGAVFTNIKLGYAIKVFLSSDKGYTAFLRFILDNRENLHLPRIRGRFKSISKDYSACRIELLDDLNDFEKRTVNALCRLILTGFLKPASFIASARETLPTLDNISFSDQYLGTMFELYRFGRSKGCTFDLHAGNVMKRNSTLVIIDPFS